MNSVNSNLVGEKASQPTLWLLPYRADQIDLALLQNQLAENQRSRFATLKNKRKVEFGITRLFLLHCLKHLLHEKCGSHKNTVEIIEQENSPPTINIAKKINLRFSISHSKNLIAIVMSKMAVGDYTWGLDVEQCRPVKNRETAAFFCNKNQLDSLKKTTAYDESYYRFWTQKEAVLKAKRSGISDSNLKMIQGDLSNKSQPLRSTLFFNPSDQSDYMISAFCQDNTTAINCQVITLDKKQRFNDAKTLHLTWKNYQLNQLNS